MATTKTRLPRGFWGQPATLDVLSQVAEGKMDPSKAASKLKVKDGGTVRWHALSAARRKQIKVKVALRQRQPRTRK